MPAGSSDRKSSAAPPRSDWRANTKPIGPSASSAWSAPQAGGLIRSGTTQRITSTGPAKPKQARAAQRPLRRSTAIAAHTAPNSKVMPTAAETSSPSSKYK
jgi:hypothetical protein